jgi:hypothetical protein
MNSELPPFRIIAAALRTTTERLVREVVYAQDTLPAWDEFAWAVARVPVDRLAELRSACPRQLRVRYDQVSVYEVSWSNLRIAALPGWEWSHSLADTLRLAGSRLYPSRGALDELAFARESQPQLQQVRWYGAPHIERIVRWLVARPPRVQTITAVAAALQDPS